MALVAVDLVLAKEVALTARQLVGQARQTLAAGAVGVAAVEPGLAGLVALVLSCCATLCSAARWVIPALSLRRRSAIVSVISGIMPAMARVSPARMVRRREPATHNR
eukprot:764221-Hanusia_phi.AAC.2